MCPSIVLRGDIGTDYESFHPSPVIAASSDAFLDNRPVVRQGDPLALRDKPNHPPHPHSIVGGVGTVSVIEQWKRRLVALAENPALTFRDTPQHLIEQYHRRQTTFIGYSEAEIAGAELRLDVQFPAVFCEYLRAMGKSQGELFEGLQLAAITEFEQYRIDALEQLREVNPELTLPPEAVVFLSHQGFAFVYLLAVGGVDGPVMKWCVMEREPQQIAAGFAQMVDVTLQLMESNNARLRAQGDYYLTL